jgi:Ribosomal protein L1p/L10e family
MLTACLEISYAGLVFRDFVCFPDNLFCHSLWALWRCRVARASFSQKEVAENVLETLKQAVEHVPKKWKNVQALYLKSADSVSLPLYQTLPEQPQRIAGQV